MIFLIAPYLSVAGLRRRWRRTSRRSCRMRVLPASSAITTPATAAISIASPSASVPCAPRKDTVTSLKFSAMKMISKTSTTAARPIAIQTRPATVARGVVAALAVCVLDRGDALVACDSVSSRTSCP